MKMQWPRKDVWRILLSDDLALGTHELYKRPKQFLKKFKKCCQPGQRKHEMKENDSNGKATMKKTEPQANYQAFQST